MRCGDFETSFTKYREGLETLDRIMQKQGLEAVRSKALEQSRLALLQMQRCTDQTFSLLEYRKLSRGSHCKCECFGYRNVDFNGLKSNLECVLGSSSMLLATDPRDYVYGLLGLSNCLTISGLSLSGANTKGPLRFNIDYSNSVGTVFEELTKYIITRDQTLNILMEHISGGGGHNELPLPSWCPDWRSYKHRSEGREEGFNVTPIHSVPIYQPVFPATASGLRAFSIEQRTVGEDGHVENWRSTGCKSIMHQQLDLTSRSHVRG